MNSLILALCGVLVIVAFIGASIGLKFNKWQDWLFVIFGFCGGLLFPLVLPSENTNRNPYFGLLFGFVTAFFVLISGWKQGRNNDKIKNMWGKIFGDKNE